MASLRQFLESASVRQRVTPHVFGGDGEKYYPDIVREVLECQRKEPKIANCDHRSVVEAIRLAVSWPLVIGASDGAALIVRHRPGFKKPQLVAMQTARGKRKILKERGGVVWMNQHCVYANEPFAPHQGDNPGVNHEVIADPHKRGPLLGAYAIAQQKHGGPKSLAWLHRSEIDRIRLDWSEDWADGDLDDLEWYAVKTAVHALCDDHLQLPENVRRLLASDRHAGRFDAEVILEATPKATATVTASMPPRSIHTPLALSAL